MREQGSAEHRTRHNLGGRDDGVRQHVDQVLAETPNERRLPKDAMRIQVHTTVVTITVVEVPVDHEHFEFLKVGQRFLPQIVSTRHSYSGGVAPRPPTRSLAGPHCPTPFARLLAPARALPLRGRCPQTPYALTCGAPLPHAVRAAPRSRSCASASRALRPYRSLRPSTS